MKKPILLAAICFIVFNSFAQFTFTTNDGKTISFTSPPLNTTEKIRYIEYYADVRKMPNEDNRDYLVTAEVTYADNTLNILNVKVNYVALNKIKADDIETELKQTPNQYFIYSMKISTVVKTERYEKEKFYGDESSGSLIFWSINEGMQGFLTQYFFPSLESNVYTEPKEGDDITAEQLQEQAKEVTAKLIKLYDTNPLTKTVEKPYEKAQKLFVRYNDAATNDEDTEAAKAEILKIAPDSKYGRSITLYNSYKEANKTSDQKPPEKEAKLLIREYPDFAYAYYVMGLMKAVSLNRSQSYAKSYAPEVVYFFSKAIELKPDEPMFYASRARYLKELGINSIVKYTKAMQDYEKVLALDPSAEKYIGSVRDKCREKLEEAKQNTTTQDADDASKEKEIKAGTAIEINGKTYYHTSKGLYNSDLKRIAEFQPYSLHANFSSGEEYDYDVNKNVMTKNKQIIAYGDKFSDREKNYPYFRTEPSMGGYKVYRGSGSQLLFTYKNGNGGFNDHAIIILMDYFGL